MDETVTHFGLRTADEAEWQEANPTLEDGQIARARTSYGLILKVGDGVTPYNDLEPFAISGAPFGGPYGVRVNATATVLGDGVGKWLPWDEAVWERGEGTWFDPTENTTRLLIPDGYSYARVSASVILEASHGETSGYARIEARKNGFAHAGMGYSRVSLEGGGEVLQFTGAIVPVEGGDYFAVNGIQDSSGNLSTAVSGLSWFQIEAW